MKPCPPARILLGLAVLLPRGCAQEEQSRHRDLEEIAARQEVELRHFEEVRAEITERGESSDARLPLGLRMGPDSSYTTFAQIGLEGLTRIGQLEWSIEVKSDG